GGGDPRRAIRLAHDGGGGLGGRVLRGDDSGDECGRGGTDTATDPQRRAHPRRTRGPARTVSTLGSATGRGGTASAKLAATRKLTTARRAEQALDAVGILSLGSGVGQRGRSMRRRLCRGNG